jgi:hypothetical protein
MTIKRSCVFFLEHLLGIQEFGNVASSSEFPDAAILVLLVPEEMMVLDTYLLLLLLSSSSSSSSSLAPLCRVFIRIFPRQTMSLRNTLLQLFCR